uniref:PBPe domain-containing protein n=1 Tax=Pristionchus pacificus TaxID=54126 RepID=A0A8R1UCB9_PRIPA
TWWVFTLVIISAYTANLAANLDDLANQTAISYGTIDGGSTMQFFQQPAALQNALKSDLTVAFWALIKMGYQKAVLPSRCHFEGSRASGLVFFPYHSRNGWRKSPVPLVPNRTVGGVARRLNPAVGRKRSLACARVFRVLESSKLKTRDTSLDSEGPNILGGHTHHTATSPAWMGIPILLSQSRGIRRNRSPSERMEREPLATTNRNRKRNTTLESRIPSHLKMWDYMNKQRTVNPKFFPSNNGKGVDRALKENYAFLMESTSLEYEVQQNCNLTQIGGVLGSKGYGIALKRGSEWTDRISRQILLYAKRGIIEMKKTKWWRS